MNINTYKKLTKGQQLKRVAMHGEHLATRLYGNRKVFLYSLNYFFVEVWLFESTEAFKSLIPFTEIKRLEPYLDLITISDVYQR